MKLTLCKKISILSIILAMSSLSACSNDTSNKKTNDNTSETDGIECGDETCTETQYCDEETSSCEDGIKCGENLCKKSQYCDDSTTSCEDGIKCGENLCKKTQYCDEATNSCEDGIKCGENLCKKSQYCDDATTSCEDGIKCGENLCKKTQYCDEATNSCEDGIKCGENLCKKTQHCDEQTSTCENGEQCGSTVCAADQFCDSETHCTKCQPNEIICNKTCINPSSDQTYCGASDNCTGANAGTTCPADQSCQSKVCTCNTGILCAIDNSGLTCTDDQNSNEHCGCTETSAGINCTTLPHVSNGICATGTCTLTCDSGWGNCDNDSTNGCETDLTTTTHCGTCTNTCSGSNASWTCNAGSCELACDNGYANCDNNISNGCEADLHSASACGSCDNVCPTGATCSDDRCIVTQCGADGYIQISVIASDGQTRKSVKAWCINDFDDLKRISSSAYPSDNTDNAYILLNDIEIQDTDWNPINHDTNGFTGYFLGNDKTISSTNTLINFSLFDGLEDSVVQDLTLTMNIKGTQSQAAFGVLSNTAQASRISNIHQVGNIETGSFYSPFETGFEMGLLIGQSKQSIIENCSTEGKITSYVQLDKDTGCIHYGGIIGSVTDTSVSHCESKFEVVCSSDQYECVCSAGGILGRVAIDGDSTSTIIDHCKADMKYDYSRYHPDQSNHTATGNYWSGNIGGIAGTFYGSIKDSHATIQSGYAKTIGGLIANNDPDKETWLPVTIENSEAVGTIANSAIAGGLIGTVKDATITHSSANVEVHGSTIGGLIGKLRQTQNTYKIEDCESKGDIYGEDTAKTNRQIVGGFIGEATGQTGSVNSNISKSHSSGNIHTTKNVFNSYAIIGGFVGDISHPEITDCYTTGTIEADKFLYAGGFAGRTNGGTIRNSHSSGDLTNTVNCEISTCENDMVLCGGFVGTTTKTQFSDSYTAGSVNCTYNKNLYVGGFAGDSVDSQFNVCASYGPIQSSQYAGGLIGRATHTPPEQTTTPAKTTNDIENCYQIGKITASKSAGLIGTVTESETPFISRNYYSFGDYGSKGAGLIYDNTVWTQLNNHYFYTTGCHEDAYCLKGYVEGSAYSGNTISGFTLDEFHEPVITQETHDPIKLIDKLNAGIGSTGKLFTSTKCTIDIDGNVRDYILPILPTIKPEFCP